MHCKAGLGRTGTNIALYMMKHYGYSAAESIALCRICRPGSIVGPQQQFLHDLEHRMKSEGDQYRRRHRGDGRGRGAGPHTPSQPHRRRPDRRLPHQHQPNARLNSGPEAGDDDGGGACSSSPGRRPTTSPLLMRRHSTASSGGGGGGAMSPTEASRRSAGIQWAGVAEGGLVVSGGGRQGFRGGGSGGNGGRIRGRGRGTAGNSGGLQRPRRGSSPLAIQHRRDEGRGEGGGGGKGVGDLMEALRLDNVKGPTEGGCATDRAAASTARGRLVPLANSSARPSTSSAPARNSRKLPAANPPRSEEQVRADVSNNPGFTTTPMSPNRSSTAGNANKANASIQNNSKNRGSTRRAAARSAAAPEKASLAWQNPGDGRRRGSGEGVRRAVRDGNGHGHGPHSQGGLWAANESPYLGGAGAPERSR